MDTLSNPTFRLIVFILAAVNEALMKFPGLPPIVVTITGVLSPIFVALLGGSVWSTGKQLRVAKAENLELQTALRATKG